eukprot:6335854-Pyramimonas_sp.AAC.1
MRNIYAVRRHDWELPPNDQKLRDEWKKIKHAEERYYRRHRTDRLHQGDGPPQHAPGPAGEGDRRH